MHKLRSPVIKICGLRRLQDVTAALAAGATMLGLVMVPGSRRELTLTQAQTLRQAIGSRAQVACVFMNQPLATVQAVCRAVQPDFVQLHGDESADYARQTGLPVIRRLLPAQWPASLPPDTLALLDPGAGSGTAFDWQAFAPDCRQALIAGGLDPHNVADAILASQAGGVDVSSGVEDAHGFKDGAKMRLFVANARLAWADLAQRKAA